MMQTLQVSLLNSQEASSQNHTPQQQSPTSSPNNNNNNSPYSSVRSMKDLLNPSSSTNNDFSNVISFQKEFPQMIHDNKSTSRLDTENTTLKEKTISPGITLPSLYNDIHKPPSSNSETSLRLPSIEEPSHRVVLSNSSPSSSSSPLESVVTDIHNAGSMNLSQLINVNAPPQYYQIMMPNPYQLPNGGSLPNIGMVVPPSTNGGSPPSPTSNNSSLPAVKELLPSANPMIQPGYPGPYPVPWYGYPPSTYMPAAPGRPAVPYYGQVQEAIPVMVEATVDEESRKRKSLSPSMGSHKKAATSSPPMGSSQSSNCQHHPKPDSDPKTVPFQLKFKSRKERPKNGAFEMQWMEHFTTLRQFYQQFGHTNVTRSTPGYKNLGNWVAEQRRKMRRGKLTKEQYELMNSIAFEWDRSYFFKPSVFTNSDEEREAEERQRAEQ